MLNLFFLERTERRLILELSVIDSRKSYVLNLSFKADEDKSEELLHCT